MITTSKIKIKIIIDNKRNLPKYQTKGSAGYDIEANEEAIIKAKEIAIISTGIMLEIPEGYEVQVRSRSGLAAKHGVFVINAPGTIDSDYRGEVKVILANFGSVDFKVNSGMRIAQMVVAKYSRIVFEESKKINITERGSGGLGHTGIE